MTPVAIVLAFVAGGSITYWILAYVRREPDEYFFGNLTTEREYWMELRGYFFREKWVVVKERLLYKQFPLTGWTQSERRIEQTPPDIGEIERLVSSMTNLICEAKTPFSPRTVVRKLPQRKVDTVNRLVKAETI